MKQAMNQEEIDIITVIQESGNSCIRVSGRDVTVTKPGNRIQPPQEMGLLQQSLGFITILFLNFFKHF